jgi:Na+-driven multidrug efflux pump
MDRPIAVDYAVKLLLASIALTLLLCIFFTIYPQPLPPNLPDNAELSGMIRAVTPVVGVLTALFNGLIAYKISQGRNWSRWMFAIFFVVGAAFTIPSLFNLWKTDQIGAVSGLVQTVIQAAAVICLFTKASRLWFADRKYDR